MISIDKNRITIKSDRATLEDKADFDSAISSIIASGENEIIVDIGNTSYLPSELMGLLMWKKKELKTKNIDLRIIRISSSLKKIFDTAMISDFFSLENAEITRV